MRSYLYMMIALSLACEPKSSDGTDGAGTGTTAEGTTAEGTTEVDTTGATGTAPTDEPRPCEGEPVEIAGEFLARPAIDDPTHLLLRFSNKALTCDDPGEETGDEPGCEDEVGDWDLILGLPSAVQAPGVYALQTDVDTLGLTVHEDCSWKGTNVLGTLEITAIDANEVKGRLCHLEGPWIETGAMNLEGSFVAPRCSQ